MTPDWATVPRTVPYASFGDPQSLNLYSYVRNRPLSRTDPTGHCDIDIGGGKKEHHWGWCIFHTLGFYETSKEKQQRIENERIFLLDHLRHADGSPLTNAEVYRLQHASSTQIDEYYQQQIQDAEEQRSLGLPPVMAPGIQSTGRTQPNNLTEQLAMEQAQSNPTAGQQIQNIQMKDPRWPESDGWVKMRQRINGVEIHYVRNTITGAVADFKFAGP